MNYKIICFKVTINRIALADRKPPILSLVIEIIFSSPREIRKKRHIKIRIIITQFGYSHFFILRRYHLKTAVFISCFKNKVLIMSIDQLSGFDIERMCYKHFIITTIILRDINLQFSLRTTNIIMRILYIKLYLLMSLIIIDICFCQDATRHRYLI